MINLPLVHLFRSPNGYYMFDANKNTIIPIDNDVYGVIS